MFDRPVLGIDPGIARLGAAIVAREGSGCAVVWADTIRTPAGMPEAERVQHLYLAVQAIIAEHQPGAMAVEKLLFNRNVTSAMGVARASGVVLLAAAQAGIDIEEYGPLEVKMAATGDGRAAKADVRRGLERFHHVSGLPTQPDAADAAAVAFCHLQQSVLRQAGRLAGVPR